MPRKTHEVTQEMLHELLDYNPDTGVFRWKERDVKWFVGESKLTPEARRNNWNAKWSGQVAGHQVNKKKESPSWVISVCNHNYTAHRLAWLYVYGKWPEPYTDHIDGNSLNNSINNLREADATVNNRNSKMQHNNKSGVTGVYWDKRINKWVAKAHTVANGKCKTIVLFRTFDFDSACRARKRFEIENGYTERHGKRSGTTSDTAPTRIE